jgi:hypothetical protein
MANLCGGAHRDCPSTIGGIDGQQFSLAIRRLLQAERA